MKVLNFGSLGYDFVYLVDHIAKEGEMVESAKLEVYCGGKGLNQSVALSRAGVSVFQAGFVGPDGGQLLQACKDNAIDTRYILNVFERTGNNVIVQTQEGLSIGVGYSGANKQNQKVYVDSVLAEFDKGDILVLQNEINLVDYIIQSAVERKMRIFLNASPVDTVIHRCDLSKIELLLINLEEGRLMSGKTEPEEIVDMLASQYPDLKVVLTIGDGGAIYKDKTQNCKQGAFKVPVIDKTSAGDAFAGYLISAIIDEKTVPEAMQFATIAAALAVAKKGAIDSIPTLEEVESAKLQPK